MLWLVLCLWGCGSVEETGESGVVTGEVDADEDGYPLREDCDDGDPSVHPGAEEQCNGIDDDCNGTIDDVAHPPRWYPDEDGDGWGDGEVEPEDTCDPTPGWVEQLGDCDDADESVNPGQEEVCADGVDNDCDGEPGFCPRAGEVGDEAVWAWFTTAHDDRSGGAHVAWADADRRDWLDVLVEGVYIALLFTNVDEGGQFPYTKTEYGGMYASYSEHTRMPVADLDCAGSEDVLAGSSLYSGPLDTLTADRRHGIQPPQYGELSASGPGDLDGDGIWDLALVAWDEESTTVGIYQGCLREDDTTPTELLEVEGARVVEITGDLTGDGLDDLVVSKPDMVQVRSWSTFEVQAAVLGEGVSWVERVGDLTGDGREDLALATEDGVVVLAGPLDGTHTLDEAAAVLQLPGAWHLTSGDVNGDGRADLLASSIVGIDGEVVACWGPLDGELEPDVRWTLEGSKGLGADVEAADADGDGIDELLLGTRGGVAYLVRGSAL